MMVDDAKASRWVKSYVINLDRNPERLQAFTARFDALGIPFERFPGVDGKTMPEEDFARFVSSRPRNIILLRRFDHRREAKHASGGSGYMFAGQVLSQKRHRQCI
jgi:GR25 family glycosyltransferase involved in LPS biosynthesis